MVGGQWHGKRPSWAVKTVLPIKSQQTVHQEDDESL